MRKIVFCCVLVCVYVCVCVEVLRLQLFSFFLLYIVLYCWIISFVLSKLNHNLIQTYNVLFSLLKNMVIGLFCFNISSKFKIFTFIILFLYEKWKRERERKRPNFNPNHPVKIYSFDCIYINETLLLWWRIYSNSLKESERKRNKIT